MAKIEADKKTLYELFNGPLFFKVPEYQRPYSWQQEQCEQLFDDIMDSERKSEYFLGTTIFQELEPIGTSRKLAIIDGQQRITTLQIFLACLRDIVIGSVYKKYLAELIFQPSNPVGGIPERVRLEVKDKEKDFFKKFVQEENSTNDNNVDSCNISTSNNSKHNTQENIINAIKYFRYKLTNFSQSEIENLIQHISQDCIVIFVSTKEFNDAYRLFTIINDRGLQLRRIDILKAQNIDPSLIKEQDDRIEYARKWEDMEDELGSEEFEKLFYFIRTIEVKEKAKEDLLKEFETNIFNKGKLVKGKPFINYVKEYQTLYKDLILDKLTYNNFEEKTNFNNLLNIMIDHLKGTDWIPPILSYYKKFNTDNIYKFLTLLEKKYLYSWSTGKTKDKRLVDMSAIIKKIDYLDSTDDVLKIKEFEYDPSEFNNIITAKDFYKKSFAKYILIKLEYLSSDNATQRTFGTISIEHILPQSPQVDSDWYNEFSNEEIENWTHHISNLILLNKRKNSSASNLDFKDKKEKYFKDKITDLPRSLQILNVSKWTPETLINRENEIVNLLK